MRHASHGAACRRLLFPAFLCLLMALLASPLYGFKSSDSRFSVDLGAEEITVFTYRPQDCLELGFVLVFHGRGRKASRMRDRGRKIADEACLAVIAPLFDEDQFPNWRYHRAGVVRKGEVQPYELWSAPKIGALVAWGRRWLDDPKAPYYLFGHSAGGQFLSRSAAYSPPSGAKRIIIANPSVYVLPSFDEAPPYGFAGMVDDDEAGDKLRAYLGLPVTIYVGDEDTGSKNLVTSDAAMRQGVNRFERGLTVYRMARDLASSNGWTFGWSLVVAEGVGHSSKKMLLAPEAELAFQLHGELKKRNKIR